MTNEEIQEGNKIISEFMGNGAIANMVLIGSNGEISNPIPVGASQDYHKSYDLLIPVWFKFRELHVKKQHMYLFNEYKTNLQDVLVRDVALNLSNFFNAMVKAIKWYNSVKTK